MRATPANVLGIVLALAGLAALPVISGCAAFDDAGTGTDAGGPGDRDGGPSDLDGGLVSPDRDASAAIDGAAAPSEFEADARGCFDFVDSDGDTLVDCADLECSATPLCCLGSSAAGCCTMAAPAALSDFGTCTGAGAAALTSCMPALTLFGSPLPDLRDGTVVPGGGERYDSGLVLPDRVDPRVSIVHVTARIRAARDADPVCAGCIDLVAVGLVAADGSFGTTSTVSPDAALVVNNTRRELRLMIGNTSVRTWAFAALPTGVDAADATYELIASPSGTLALRAGGHTLADGVPWAPAGPARVVAYGRTANPGGGDPPGVAIASLTVGSEVCDAPASIERGATSILPERVDPWWRATDQPTSPSVSGSEMLFAFDGRIHRAQATSEGRFRATGDPHTAGSAILVANQVEAWRSLALGEPELVHDGARWIVYFTAIGTGGRRVIGRALGGATLEDPFVEIAPFYPPVAADDGADYDGPSYVRTAIGGTATEPMREYLAVRRHTADGGELVVLSLGGSSAPASAGAVIDPALDFAAEAATGGFVHRAGRTDAAFDADEVASPGLVAYDGLIRLYFGGRRGTRWSIGMLASSDGLHWHLVDQGEPLLTGSGSGFDAISVSEPEPVWIGDELRLYYTASDGVQKTIGMGHHRVTEVSE